MDRQLTLTLILGISAVSGIFSPFLTIAVPITAALMPEIFPKSIGWVLFFSSVFVASATLLFAGIPAALYERLLDRDPASQTSMYIWLAGCLILTLPALRTLGVV
jgi:hypothetical protein